MGFMQLFTYKGAMWRAEGREGVSLYPSEDFSCEWVASELDVDADSVELVEGWFARYSAPGYMDCTDWCGPFASEKLAADYVRDLYGDDDESEVSDDT